jgi:VWFA-related protein
MSKRSLLLILSIVSMAVGLSSARAQERQPTPPSPLPSPSPAAEDRPSFPAQVEQVNVDVVVTDKKKTSIAGLTKDDFTILEDGAPQTIVSFEAVQLPPQPEASPAPRPPVSTNTAPELKTGRTFVIVFDDIHLTPQQAHRAKQAVAAFLSNGVREGDRVTLVATGGSAWWSTRMQAGRDELITMLKRLDGRHIPEIAQDRVSDYEAMRIHVYHDAQVEERVARRFETYGINQRQGGGSSASDNPAGAEGDPYVRGRASEVYFQAVARNRITLEVIERVLNSLQEVRGRKSMILVSEGFIYDPNMDEFKKVLQASRRANMAIYFVDTRGLGGSPIYQTAEFGPPIDTRDIGAMFTEDLEASEGSESIASDSGGFTVKNTNDLSKGIQRIADESRNYYLLGYNPSNTARDGRFRKITVKLEKKGLEVRARKGYYAPLDAGAKAASAEKDAKKKGGSDPEIQMALDSPYESDQIPMRMTAYVFDETLLGKASVVVAADIDVRGFAFEERDGRAYDTLEFLLVVAHRETGEFFRYDQKVEMKLLPATRERLTATWFPLAKDFELAPGGYQAKMVVRDRNSKHVGSVVHDFEVPDLSQFRASTPIISDTLQPSQDPKARPKPALLARRVFPAGSTLYFQYEVFGAAKEKGNGMPRVTAGFQIRRPDGTVVNRGAPTPITPTSLGKVSRMVGASLENVTPGPYEFVLSLKDEIGGKTLELREPFEVGPPAAGS